MGGEGGNEGGREEGGRSGTREGGREERRDMLYLVFLRVFLFEEVLLELGTVQLMQVVGHGLCGSMTQSLSEVRALRRAKMEPMSGGYGTILTSQLPSMSDQAY